MPESPAEREKAMMEFRMDLSGKWEVHLPDGTAAPCMLPGTLDENGIGGPDLPENQWQGDIPTNKTEDDFFGARGISTRFTRRHTFTGAAEFLREVNLPWDFGEGRWILTVERGRQLRCEVNGKAAKPLYPGSLITPWQFEITSLRPGKNQLRIVSDNSYPGWPAEAILRSSAATDETQTNWNGLLGQITLERKPEGILLGARMIWDKDMGSAELQADLSLSAKAAEGGLCQLQVQSEIFSAQRFVYSIKVREGIQTLRKKIEHFSLRKTLEYWDMDHPKLYGLKLSLWTPGQDWKDETEVHIGIRSFGKDERGRLCLNGRRVFLRSEANCAAFPETGYPPMTVEAWEEIIRQYQAYGVNCLRFHSHCPPEAAFTAADRLGMLMQPELSQWDPERALEDGESWEYYRTELRETLRFLSPHPSFVMLTLGNELHCGEVGTARMAELVKSARRQLPDRLYARGSNDFYGRGPKDPDSDFYTAQRFGEYRMRAIGAGMDREHPEKKLIPGGHLNHAYPGGRTNYSEGMAALREWDQRPMFSFEVGQYEVLPDFHELEMFHGVTEPENYRMIRSRVEQRGLLPGWDRMVEASGELALIGYQEEVEAVMRTPAMSGISLLSLQDFPGQGTALVGMMNAHLKPKPYDFARPERFQAFFRDAVPLPEPERYTWFSGETMRLPVRAVNYGRRTLIGTLVLELRNAAGESLVRVQKNRLIALTGEAEIAFTAKIKLPETEKPAALELYAYLEEAPDAYSSRRRIWVYPDLPEEAAGEVLCLRALTGETLERLAAGARVLLEPPSEEKVFPGGIRGQFTTDFWSVGTFPQQEGGMGLLIQAEHPAFREFPTAFHTDYQWWLMAGQRSLRLPDEQLADGILIRQLDSYARLRTLALLLEVRVGQGRLLLSTMDLAGLPPKPEVKALRRSLLRYAGSDAFEPKVSVGPEELRALLPGVFLPE